jgi:hypothetical protein
MIRALAASALFRSSSNHSKSSGRSLYIVNAHAPIHHENKTNPPTKALHCSGILGALPIINRWNSSRGISCCCGARAGRRYPSSVGTRGRFLSTSSQVLTEDCREEQNRRNCLLNISRKKYKHNRSHPSEKHLKTLSNHAWPSKQL